MNIKINLSSVPVNNSSLSIYPDYLTDEKSNMKFYNLELTKFRLNISESTIRRLIKKYKNELFERYYVYFHGKYYFSLNIREPLIESNDIRTNYARYLKKYDWKIWGSVNFNEIMSLSQIRDIANLYFDTLKKKFPNVNFTFFFATELNSCREGYHLHYLLDFNNENDFKRILYESDSFFKIKRKKLATNTLIEKYDKEKNGISYILKQIKKLPDGYDVLLS